jgi:hypothetical protein
MRVSYGFPLGVASEYKRRVAASREKAMIA